MIHLRACTAADEGFVYEALCLLEDEHLNRDAFISVFRHNLLLPNVYYVIAEKNNQPAGFGSLHIQPLLHHIAPVGEVQEMIVLPDFRSTGVGKQLLDHLTAIAVQEGCDTIEMASSIKRENAHRFYMREGYFKSHYKFTKKL